MKLLLLLVATILTVCHCEEVENEVNWYTDDESVSEDKNEDLESGDDGIVIAVINEYADKLSQKISSYALKHNLDPISLPDMKEWFVGAQILLDNGTLNGISTMQRTNDARVGYSSQTRRLGVEFPIDLNKVYFLYHFKVKLLILEVQGHLKGEIKYFKANVKFAFDFHNYKATLEDVSSDGMGPITLTFDDKNLIADILNLLSTFVTAILHPLIEGIIHGNMVAVGEHIVEEVNKGIDHFLHPNSTQLFNR